MISNRPTWILVPALALALLLLTAAPTAAAATSSPPTSTAEAPPFAFHLEQRNALDLAFDTVDGDPSALISSFYAGTPEGHFAGDVRYQEPQLVAHVHQVETGEALTLVLEEEPTVSDAQRVTVRFEGIGAMAFLVRDSGITPLGSSISDCALLEQNGLLRAIRTFLDRVEPLKEKLVTQRDPRSLPLAILDTVLRFAARAPYLVDDCRASLPGLPMGVCELHDSYGDCMTCCDSAWQAPGAVSCILPFFFCKGPWCKPGQMFCVAVFAYSDKFCKQYDCPGKSGAPCGDEGVCRMVCADDEVPTAGLCDDPINQNSSVCCAKKDTSNCVSDWDCKDGDCCVNETCTSCNPTD